MTEGGEELFDLGPITGGAGDLLIAEDQNLKVLVAFHAVILKDGHINLRNYYQYNTPEDIFPVFSRIFSPSPSMI